MRADEGGSGASGLRLAAIGAACFLAVQAVELAFLVLLAQDVGELCKWDCWWYDSIVKHGYHLAPSGGSRGGSANWAFFPLFPLSARAVSALLGIDTRLALVLTSKLFFLTACVAFVWFAVRWRPDTSPWTAGAVVAFNPYWIYGNVGYSESLFLTLTCLSFHALHGRSFVQAGLFGGLSTATRVVAGSFGIAYAIHLLRHGREGLDWPRALLGLALVPLGLFVYMAFLHRHVGDALAFSHVQIAWNHAPGNPLRHVDAVLRGGPTALLAAAATVVAAAAIAVLLARRDVELAAYSAVATLLPLSVDLVSLPRYVWWQAPILFAVVVALGRLRALAPFWVAGCIVFSWFVYGGWLRWAHWSI